jgi:hypothetical protein
VVTLAAVPSCPRPPTGGGWRFFLLIGLEAMRTWSLQVRSSRVFHLKQCHTSTCICTCLRPHTSTCICTCLRPHTMLAAASTASTAATGPDKASRWCTDTNTSLTYTPAVGWWLLLILYMVLSFCTPLVPHATGRHAAAAGTALDSPSSKTTAAPAHAPISVAGTRRTPS